MIEELVNEMEYYRDYVLKQDSFELYLFLSQFRAAECTEDLVDFQSKETKGMSVRAFHKNHTDFAFIDGISKERLAFMLQNDKFWNKMPQAYMASNINGSNNTFCLPDNFNFDFGKIREIDANFCENSWNDTEKIIENYGERLSKLHLQYQLDAYFIFNSLGVKGYSIRSTFAKGFELASNKPYFCKISPGIVQIKNSEIEKHIFGEDNAMLAIVPVKKISYILFSETAIAKILYFLVFLLNREVVISGQSKFTFTDIGKKIFSENFTLKENSALNKTIIGTLDGEGIYRKPSFIIKDGVLNNFFSMCCLEKETKSTGSAFRFNHRTTPQVKASKVSVVGDKSLEWILENYNDIAVVNDIIGITESLNPITTEFEAYADTLYYRNGSAEGNMKLNMKTSIMNILNEIECISEGCSYGADGSIFMGSFLIKNNNIV